MNSGKLLLYSNAAELMEKVFYISGREATVRETAKDVIIMNEESFGNMLILSVFAKDGIKTKQDERYSLCRFKSCLHSLPTHESMIY